MNPGTREIGEALHRSWAGVLGSTISPASANHARIEEPSLVAVIHVSGAWRGSLVMLYPTALARSAASTLLRKPSAEVTDADAGQLVGELTRVAARDLFSALPGRFDRSAPLVLDGWQPGLFVGPHLVRRFAFDCEGQVVIVEVLEPYAGHRVGSGRGDAPARGAPRLEPAG